MVVIVPLWFWEFSSTIYFIAMVIGIFLSYFSFKLYNFTSKKQHLLLHIAFIFIAASFLAIFVGNLESYYNFQSSCNPNCIINPNDPTYFWIRFGNYGYYSTSLIGYAFLALSYWYSEKKNLRFALLPAVGAIVQSPTIYVLFPFVNTYFNIFHILSILFVSYIVLYTLKNYRKTKSFNSLLVLSGFVAIDFYHLLMYLIPFYAETFALAHFALLIGFGSLLFMLIRVNRK